MAWQEGGLRARMDLRLGQRLVMTPQLQQAIKLLQLSRLELNQVIELEMTENPLLEETTSDSDTAEEEFSDSPESSAEDGTRTDDETGESLKNDEMDLSWENAYDDDDRERIESGVTSEAAKEMPSYDQTLARPISLGDHLLWQLGLISLSDQDQEIGVTLIGNIDDHGYLETSLEEIAESVRVLVSDVERVLKVVQGLDPPGVGARNLIECLLIQVQILNLSGTLVSTMIQHHLEDIEKRKYAQIAKVQSVAIPEVLQASKIIEHLEPKPGRPFYSSDNFSIIPDVFVVKVSDNETEEVNPDAPGKYTVVLNDDGMPKMKISNYYRSLLRSKEPGDEKTRTYIKDKYQSAMWLIRSIDQRNQTILKTANSILKFQSEFMDKGPSKLKPLVLKQVAEDIEMHESTVSRVTTHKYIYTPQGIFELKYFFNGALPSGGETEALSSVAIREKIERMVLEENSLDPLTDQEIVERLKKEGVEMARRTVSKYRAELKIAPANRRRRIAL
ncbi:MAG: RNA polymerase factor sigma-54 [Nitrospirota bacterium]